MCWKVRTEAAMRLVSERGMAWLNRAVVSGRIIPYLVAMMLAIMMVAALTVHFLSPKAFTTFGDEVWWAAQTVTTVGYGDVVPTTSGGRFIGGIVMFVSVATVSLVTAVVTAGFVAFQQRRLSGDVERHAELRAALERIEQRIEALER
jgi:voltage-gated potassium channel